MALSRKTARILNTEKSKTSCAAVGLRTVGVVMAVLRVLWADQRFRLRHWRSQKNDLEVAALAVVKVGLPPSFFHFHFPFPSL